MSNLVKTPFSRQSIPPFVVPITGVPLVGQVPTATTDATASWQTPVVPEILISGTPTAGQIATATGPTTADWEDLPPATGNSFTFTQLGAVSTWDVYYPLTYEPAVMIVDSGGYEVMGDITRITLGHLSVAFSQPISGVAYLS